MNEHPSAGLFLRTHTHTQCEARLTTDGGEEEEKGYLDSNTIETMNAFFCFVPASCITFCTFVALVHIAKFSKAISKKNRCRRTAPVCTVGRKLIEEESDGKEKIPENRYLLLNFNR